MAATLRTCLYSCESRLRERYSQRGLFYDRSNKMNYKTHVSGRGGLYPSVGVMTNKKNDVSGGR